MLIVVMVLLISLPACAQTTPVIDAPGPSPPMKAIEPTPPIVREPYPPAELTPILTLSYTIYQTFPLTQAVHGVDGTLQLLQDARLTGEYRAHVGGMGYLEPVGQFKETPPQNALLRIVNRQGQAVVTQTWERSLATLAEVNLDDTGPLTLPGRNRLNRRALGGLLESRVPHIIKSAVVLKIDCQLPC